MKTKKTPADVERALERIVPMLRAMLSEHFASGPRERRPVFREEPRDHEVAAEVDEVTRARARALLGARGRK